jgi:hypothetical protein
LGFSQWGRRAIVFFQIFFGESWDDTIQVYNAPGQPRLGQLPGGLLPGQKAGFEEMSFGH